MAIVTEVNLHHLLVNSHMYNMFSLALLTLCCVAMVISMDDTVREKRLVLHSDEDVAMALQTISAELRSMNTTIHSQQNKIQALETSVQSRDATIQSLLTTAQARDAIIQSLTTTTQSLQSTGQYRDTAIHTMQTQLQSLEHTKLAIEQVSSTYIRWGKTDCEANGTQLVYKGFTGGTAHNLDGGPADYICLTQDPLWGYYTNVSTYAARVYGTEYQVPSSQSQNMFGQNLLDHDVPCSVCRAPRATSIMIPGRNQCYPGWTMEYHGYLVANHYSHKSSSNYVCLDIRPEAQLGDSSNDNGQLMYVVEAMCGSLTCPPYVQYREITCVVCSI